jgi:hypothetical protein
MGSSIRNGFFASRSCMKSRKLCEDKRGEGYVVCLWQYLEKAAMDKRVLSPTVTRM